MQHTRHDRGIARGAVLGAIALVLAVGATVWVLNAQAPPSGKVAIETGFVGDVVSSPAFAEPPTLPAVGPDSEKILEGELIKYRDDDGRVKFRHRDPISGIGPGGQPIYWTADITMGPKMERASRQQTRRKSATNPPKFKFEDGKMVPVATVGEPGAGDPGADAGAIPDVQQGGAVGGAGGDGAGGGGSKSGAQGKAGGGK